MALQSLIEALQQSGISLSTNLPDPYESAKEKAEWQNQMQGNLTGYDCKRCLNRGYFVIAKEDGTLASTACRCMSIRKSIALLERSGMKHMVKPDLFDRFETLEEWQKSAKQMAIEYSKNANGRWFLASGTSGCGKTHLCVAICRELMLKGMETRYVLWREAISQLKARQNTEDYEKLMAEFQTVAVLYIDDFLKVGKNENPTIADVNIAFEMLNSRYNNPNLITVISTERSISALLKFDEATASRIIQRCMGNILEVHGKDKNWRLKGAENK